MEWIGTMLAFLAVLVACAWLWRATRLPAGATPLVVLSVLMLALSVAGCFSVLVPAVWVLLCAAIVGAVALAFGRFPWKEFCTPGFCLFAMGGALLIVFYAVQKPMFATWDEFSFWGTAAKLVKNNGSLYVTADIGWNWVPTHRPALIMLGYFFDFLGAYAEWRIYAAYSLLALAVLAAMGAGLPAKNWPVLAPLWTMGGLAPILLTVYRQPVGVSEVYRTVLADVPLGLVMGGTLALYYGVARHDKRFWWAPLPALWALCLIKDTGFALALVAAVIMGLDALVDKGRRWRRALQFLAAAGGCVVFFMFWTAYLSRAAQIDATNVGGAQEMGMVQMMLQGVKETLGFVPRSEKYSAVMSGMISMFFSARTTMLGSGAIVTLVILALCALAIWAGGGAQQRGNLWFTLLSAGGFAAYYLFVGFTYVYVFKEAEAASLVGYERYVYPFYIGWMIAALVVLAHTVRARRFLRVPQMALACLAVLCIWRTGQFLTPRLTVLDENPTAAWNRAQIAANVKAAKEHIAPNSRVFFINQGDNGQQWFMYSYEFLPYVLDYSYGGGTLAAPGVLEEGTPYYISLTRAQLAEYLLHNACDYVFIVKSDLYLTQEFSLLFEGGLSPHSGPALYRFDAQRKICVPVE